MGNTRQLTVSIITVCLNSDQTIRDTLESVCQQSYSAIEHVIIDGVSTDNTLKIVGEYSETVSNIVSETDKGIYDAMNKGISCSTGDVIFFLNSDDQFYDANVVSDVVKVFQDRADISLVYGDAVYQADFGEIVSRYDHVNKNNIIFGHLCHQAVFARRELFTNLGEFNLKFSINADYDWLLRVFFSDTNTYYIKRNIAKFNAMGRHMVDVEFLQKERRAVRMKYMNPVRYYFGDLLYRARRKYLRIIGLNHG